MARAVGIFPALVDVQAQFDRAADRLMDSRNRSRSVSGLDPVYLKVSAPMSTNFLLMPAIVFGSSSGMTG